VNNVFFKSLINLDEVPNHKFGVNEELEEHLLLMQFAVSECPGSILFPELGTSIEDYKESLKILPCYLDFVKKCIVRILYYKGLEGKTYIGCPLGFSRDPALLRKHFPYAQFVVCVRNPTEAVPSYIDLIQNSTREPFDEKFAQRMKILNKVYSEPIYRELSIWEGDVDTIYIDFELWKKKSPVILKHLWKTLLEWECKEGDE
jgi:hypothetical protein